MPLRRGLKIKPLSETLEEEGFTCPIHGTDYVPGCDGCDEAILGFMKKHYLHYAAIKLMSDGDFRRPPWEEVHDRLRLAISGMRIVITEMLKETAGVKDEEDELMLKNWRKMVKEELAQASSSRYEPAPPPAEAPIHLHEPANYRKEIGNLIREGLFGIAFLTGSLTAVEELSMKLDEIYRSAEEAEPEEPEEEIEAFYEDMEDYLRYRLSTGLRCVHKGEEGQILVGMELSVDDPDAPTYSARCPLCGREIRLVNEPEPEAA